MRGTVASLVLLPLDEATKHPVREGRHLHHPDPAKSLSSSGERQAVPMSPCQDWEQTTIFLFVKLLHFGEVCEVAVDSESVRMLFKPQMALKVWQTETASPSPGPLG